MFIYYMSRLQTFERLLHIFINGPFLHGLIWASIALWATWVYVGSYGARSYVYVASVGHTGPYAAASIFDTAQASSRHTT
jgi:hypothetical protein